MLAVILAAVLVPCVLDDDDETSRQQRQQRHSDGTASRDAELDRAKAASVLIQAFDEAGEVLGNGSGSIISEDGLILTNAHVAKPSAPGLGSEDVADPASYQIALVSGDDDVPAAAEYIAEPIVADGVLDLAVMQITADNDGNPVDAADLDLPEPLPIGDSDELRTGDEIIALGFPGVAHVATTEEFDAARADRHPRCGLDLPPGRCRSTTTGPGSTATSGSARATPVAPRSTRTASSSASTPRSSPRPPSPTPARAAASPAGRRGSGRSTSPSRLIEIAEDGGDPSYVSPFLEEMPEPPSDMTAAEVVAAGWTGDGQGGCTGTSSLEAPQEYAVPDVGQVIYTEFLVTGIEDGTPVNFDFYDLTGETVLSSGEQVWAFGPSARSASTSRSRCPRVPMGRTRSSGSVSRCSPRTRWCSSRRSSSRKELGRSGARC